MEFLGFIAVADVLKALGEFVLWFVMVGFFYNAWRYVKRLDREFRRVRRCPNCLTIVPNIAATFCRQCGGKLKAAA